MGGSGGEGVLRDESPPPPLSGLSATPGLKAPQDESESYVAPLVDCWSVLRSWDGFTCVGASSWDWPRYGDGYAESGES